MKTSRALGIGILLGGLIVWAYAYRVGGIPVEKTMIYRLSKPLRIATANPEDQYWLPAGTTLYFDKSMPEGFDRYHLYINVEGAGWTLSPPEKEGLIAPLTADATETGEPPARPSK